MFFDKTDEIIPYIKANPNFQILVATTPEINDLLIQNLTRFVRGKEYTFISLRNIEVNTKYQRLGIFKDILIALVGTNRPVMVHDILDDNVYTFTKSLGFSDYADVKSGNKLRCLIKIQGV